jgi:acyl dehydratase
MRYDELEVGAKFTGHGRTLTEADLTLACMLSGDWHPIHADEEWARAHGPGHRIFHGTFGILLTMGMATTLPKFDDRIIGATGLREWKYRAPLFVGDTVHVEAEIASKRVTSDGKRAVVERALRLINQKGTVTQEGFAGAMLGLAEQGKT